MQFELKLLAQLQVERAEWLVEQQHLWLVDDGSGEGNALLLPAGKLVGSPTREGYDLHQLHHGGREPDDVVGGHPLHPQAKGYVFRDAQVREQRVGLEDGVDRALPSREPQRHSAADTQLAAVGQIQARDDAQQRGLAAAGGTEQREELTAPHVEGHAREGFDLAEAPREMLALDGEG